MVDAAPRYGNFGHAVPRDRRIRTCHVVYREQAKTASTLLHVFQNREISSGSLGAVPAVPRCVSISRGEARVCAWACARLTISFVAADISYR